MACEAALAELLDLLVTGAPPALTNQYAAADPALDHPDGPARRRANLVRYLRAFSAARWVLCAEAAGYNGARFSGVALTDEAKLAGPTPLPWAGAAAGYRRGSADGQPLHRELSSSIVWRALGERTDVALWNAVPWHPAGPAGPLSNRPPAPAERAAGLVVLRHLLTRVLPAARPIAVGRVAQALLAELGDAGVPCLRHPANGGARLFAEGLARHCPPPA
jgi:hypothetical protein